MLLIGWSGLACGEDIEEPNPVQYEDPDTAYGPPSSTRAGVVGKADEFNTRPRIISIQWRSEAECHTRGISEVILSVTVEDADSDITELEFEGAVTGCDNLVRNFGPMLNEPVTRLRCHHVSTHTGLVTVVDPSGDGDSLAFTFGPCSDGSVGSHRD
jgi:hypothetical protein